MMPPGSSSRHLPLPGPGSDADVSIRAPDHRISPSRTKQACDLGRYHFAKLVLPFYLLREPVIVAAAWLIVRWHAPLPGKYAALVIVSFCRDPLPVREPGPAVPHHPGSCPA